MYVRVVMTPDPVVVWPSTSVLYARRLMERHGIRHLPVVADAGVVGMVSARDIVMTDRQLAASLAELQSDLVTGRYRRVESVMSTPVVTAAPDMPLDAAARLLATRRIGALPVVDNSWLVGILTTTDCLLALSRLGAGNDLFAWGA